MQFVNIVTALTLATLAQAFVLPASPSDGVYAVFTYDNGTEVHTKISDSSETRSLLTDRTAVNEESALERRQAGRIWCGCGFNMNHRNCDTAVAALKSQMKPSFVGPGLSYYSIRGDVVAFACNRDPDTSWLLVASDYTQALKDITNSCGLYIAGATEFGDPNKALIVGYARWKSGDQFCAGATSSPANSC